MRRTRLFTKRSAEIKETEEHNSKSTRTEEKSPLKTPRKSSRTTKKTKLNAKKTAENENSSLSVETKVNQNVTKESRDDSGSSSDSDLETYLKPAHEIDLNSSFFQTKTTGFEAIESNIFAGINKLSDSESDNESQKELLVAPEKNVSKTIGTHDQKPTTSKLNFQQLHDYTKKLEEAKKVIEKYEATKKRRAKSQSANTKEEEDDISNLLSKGETTRLDMVNVGHLGDSMQSSDFESYSDSEKEDWEEVEENESQETKSIVPREGVQITVELPGAMRQKQKKGMDLIAMMKRRLNKIKKENQVYVHKVHLLCWLAHGNYVNKILNNENLLALGLSLIPSQHCYPPDRTDLKYLEQITQWCKNTIPITEEKPFPKDIPLQTYLTLQMTNKRAYGKRMLVYIFICILRSLGIQCRLVLSFRVAPIRPPASELHSLSTKTEADKKGKNSKEKTGIVQKKEPPVTKPDVVEKQGSSGSKPSSTSKIKLENLKMEKGNSKQKTTKKEDADLNKKPKIKLEKLKSSQEKTKDIKQTNDRSESSRKKSPSTKKKSNEPQQVVPQLDGPNDDESSEDDNKKTSKNPRKVNLKKLSQETPNLCPVKKHPKRLKSLPKIKERDSEDDFKPEDVKKVKLNRPRRSIRDSTTGTSKNTTKVSPNTLKKEPNQPKQSPKHSKANLNNNKSPSNGKSGYFERPGPSTRSGGDIRNDIISIMKGRIAEERTSQKQKLVKPRRSIKTKTESDYDSDYAPEPVKKKHHDSDDEFHKNNKVKVKQRVKVKQEAAMENEIKERKGLDLWVEVFLEAEEKWISADVTKGKFHCVNELHTRASHPISYIVAWNNDNGIKDITQRYCPNWNTVTRKLRVDQIWWGASLKPFTGKKTARDKEEDEELARLQLEKPLPTAISEYKNHPLYVLKRHLLKFEAIYPPNAVTLGFIRKEAVYSRDCVHTLHSREIWVKHAMVVRPGEKPYKIVKARPKYDRLSGQVITDLPLEIFGKWQVEDYVPPVAKDGIVPRNAYGNVELFKACMLPKGTVHLQLPGLNKVAKKMNIDCAPAVVGFDFHAGGSHPTFDGFVVCEEHSEVLVAAWYTEQEEQEKRELEKVEKRVYGNWKRLIKGLLIRERLKARYDYGSPSKTEVAGGKKRKTKGPRFVSKKKKICSSDSDMEAEGV